MGLNYDNRAQIKQFRGKFVFYEEGNKKRRILLTESLKKHLQEYIKEYNPEEHLFEGQTGRS